MKKNFKWIGVVESSNTDDLRFNVRRVRKSVPAVGSRVYISQAISSDELNDGEIVDIANEVARSMPADSDSQEEIIAIVREALKVANRKLRKRSAKLLKALKNTK